MAQFWNSNPRSPFWKTDPASLFWVTLAVSYVYDAVARLVEINYPDGSAEIYSYDSMGNRTFSGLPTYVYDLLGRLVQYNCPDGSSETYTYDSMGNRILVVDVSEGG